MRSLRYRHAVAAAVGAVAIAAPSADAGSSPPGGPATFVGQTSQFPCRMDTQSTCAVVAVLMSKSMARVKTFQLGFEAACQVPGKFFGTTYFDFGVAAKRSHGNRTAKFRHHDVFDRSVGEGLSAHVEVTHTGKLTYGKKGAGTFQVTIAVFDAGGAQIDTCDSGLVTYTVRAQKRA